MEINEAIYYGIKCNNNMITTAEVQKMGFSKTLLSTYVKEGLLERTRHGVYALPDEVQDDLFTLMLSSKNLIFSHESLMSLV